MKIKSKNIVRFIFPALLLFCFPGFVSGDVIDDLDNGDFAVRRLATERLLTDESLALEQIRAWLARDLTLEQTRRLLNVARHHVLLNTLASESVREEPAQPIALGFRHQPGAHLNEQDQPIGAILVIATLPGLPAHGRLRPGDLLMRINDQTFPRNVRFQDFAKHITQLPAAKPLAIDLIRDGQPIYLTLPVSSLAIMTRLYNEQSKLREPYARAWQAFLAAR
jgi:hypothetical protein